MARAPKSKKHSSSAPQTIHKARGVISPRVQRVGPEHFGIVCVDCAKARSKWMLTDFYGRILVPPTEAEHTQACFAAMIERLRTALEQAGIRDQIVVIERTGRYHRPIQRAFAKAGFEVRIIHPLTTKQHRQSANPGNKTDDTDLAAMQRGAVNGFGLFEPPVGPIRDSAAVTSIWRATPPESFSLSRSPGSTQNRLLLCLVRRKRAAIPDLLSRFHREERSGG